MENVYVFELKGTGYYKIGMTQSESIFDRLQSIKTYSPFNVEVFAVIETSKARLLEKKLHDKFNDKRMNGEFFKLDEPDLNYIKTLQNKRVDELKSFFWKNIINSGVTLNDLKTVFEACQIKIKTSDENENQNIYKFLEDNFYNEELTNNEILQILQTEYIIDEFMSKKQLGMILTAKYNQKIKRIEGVTQRVYKLC